MTETELKRLAAELDRLEYALLTDAEAAEAVSAVMTEPRPAMVFGSFRTLADILEPEQYNTLRSVIEGLAAAPGNYLVADMLAMLRLPGNEHGDAGGLNLAAPRFAAMLAEICGAEQLAPVLGAVPAAVAAYVASQQPQPQPLFGPVTAHQVAAARALGGG